VAGDDGRECGAFARNELLLIRFSNSLVISSHNFAISPRVFARVLPETSRPPIRGRRECRALDAPQPGGQKKTATPV
jgi:hypothetical protein